MTFYEEVDDRYQAHAVYLIRTNDDFFLLYFKGAKQYYRYTPPSLDAEKDL